MIILTTILVMLVSIFAYSLVAPIIPKGYTPQVGDFLFQSLPESDLALAIEGATHSSYSHVGVVIKNNQGQWHVREAIGPVKDTPLIDFITRGRGQVFDVYRLKKAHKVNISKMIHASEKYMGRPYDMQYAMDDDKIYCSELWYKSMQQATGMKLGKTILLGNLNWQPYRATIEKYNQGPVPLQREMITPKDLAEASQLELVYKTAFPSLKKALFFLF